MTAQPTPEQRADAPEIVFDLAADLCSHPGAGGSCHPCLERVYAIFAAGHAAALEGAETEWGVAFGTPALFETYPSKTAAMSAAVAWGKPLQRRDILPWREVQP